MVVQTAAEAVANANATTTTADKGACLWQTQEWLESPHQYPDATSQWNAAKYRHPGDTEPPAGFPVFWTGGSQGYGHAAVSVGDGKIRSTDQQSNYHCDTIPISEVHADWGLTYAGWSEDIASIRLPYAAGDPSNPNGVQVGDLVLVVANGELNGRAQPASDGPVVTTRPYGDRFTVAALQDGWAQEAVVSLVSTATAGNTSPGLVDVKATDYLHGVDISSHQAGWTPDGTEEYVFVKATEGKSYTNPAYEDQLYEARAAGLVVGHYHWLNDGDVAAQVDYFLAVADLQPGDLIACDWEDSSNPTTSQKDQWITTVQQRLSGANRVGLYCNRDWWINHDTSSYYGDFLWIANYTSADSPGIEADWLFWQWTDSPIDQNRARFADTAALREWAGYDSEPDPDPGPGPSPSNGAWFSTDYLFPQIKPDPTNPNTVTKGDTVEVTANGGLTARILPGGPKSLDKNGKTIVRPTGYQFQVTGDLVDGWVTGGTNWYSSDYLQGVEEPPTPTEPSWSSTPTTVLPCTDMPGSVSYLQGGVRVEAAEDYGPCWVLAQDYNDSGDPRIHLYSNAHNWLGYMTIKDGGHCQTFHAYRAASGNLWIWTLIGDVAYRIRWRDGATITTKSSDVIKADYKGRRPVGSYEHYVGFRSATDTHETLSIHDRFGFTDGSVSTAPLHEVTVSKRTDQSQQSWAVTLDRIYRLYGNTDENCQGSPSKRHYFDVIDWSGTMLLSMMDVTAMHTPGSPECEPEAITFSAAPGDVLVGKREGPSSASKRSFAWWTMTGLP